VCIVCSCPSHFAVSGGFDFALGCAVRNAYEARVFCLGRGTIPRASVVLDLVAQHLPAPDFTLRRQLHRKVLVFLRGFGSAQRPASASIFSSRILRAWCSFSTVSFGSRLGCRCQEHCERPPIHGPRFSVRSIFSTGAGVRFCCVLRFPLREERAQKYLCRPVPLKRFRIGLSSPLPISISRLVSSLRARRPDLSRYRCGYWLPRLARRSSLSASSVFGLASAVPSPDFAEFVLPPAAVDR
jgi:hypothetical protein